MLFSGVAQLIHQQIRLSSKKSGGSTSNGRTSRPKFLGFKKLQGAKVIIGNIILRQRGYDVGLGRDHTIYAKSDGRVVLHYDIKTQKRYVSVDDGTLPNLPSKVESKKRLADAIDPLKYVGLSQQLRYEYVMQTIKTVFKKEGPAGDFTGRVRKFNLVDLTML